MYIEQSARIPGPEPVSIRAGHIVRLRFKAIDLESGNCLQYGDDLYYMHGGFGGVFPKVEAYLEGCRLQQKVTLTLPPEEGYGQIDESKIIQQPLHTIPVEAQEPGCILEGELEDNLSMPFTVVAIEGDTVTLDGNHPWAGRTLHFEFEILEIRDSTPAEQLAGYPLAS